MSKKDYYGKKETKKLFDEISERIEKMDKEAKGKKQKICPMCHGQGMVFM